MFKTIERNKALNKREYVVFELGIVYSIMKKPQTEESEKHDSISLC